MFQLSFFTRSGDIWAMTSAVLPPIGSTILRSNGRLYRIEGIQLNELNPHLIRVAAVGPI